MVQIITPDALLFLGNQLVGFDANRQVVRRQKNLERFCCYFGSKPAVYSAIWTDLQTSANVTALVTQDDINGGKTCVEHLLMAAHFLKCYPKDNQAEGIFKLSDTTIRKWVWLYIEKLQALKQEKIMWDACMMSNVIFALSVDGVHCRIFEPNHGRYSKNPAYYSHKFKQAGLDYEVALSVHENKCIWTNGPFPAGKSDISVFRAANGLKAKMVAESAGKLGIANLGYRGEADLLTTPNSHDDAAVRQFKSRVLARHEKFNGQLKNFGCLSERFRHGILKHQMCFEAVTVICQYQLENGTPLNAV